MDNDRSISEAVRHLEDLRAAGYITAEQFAAEVRELLDAVGADPDEIPDGLLDDGHGLALEDPGPPEGFDPLAPYRPLPQDPPPAPASREPLPDEEPWLQSSPAAATAAPRVTVKGRVPWDRDDAASGARMERMERTGKDEDGTHEERTRKELHHRELADMASRDVSRLQRKRSPRAMVLASVLLPGLGQFLLDQPGLGMVFMAVHLLCLVFIVGFGEWDALYVMGPTVLLAAALAQKHAMLHNYQLERRRLMAERRAESRDASMNLERSMRRGEWDHRDQGDRER